MPTMFAEIPQVYSVRPGDAVEFVSEEEEDDQSQRTVGRVVCLHKPNNSLVVSQLSVSN